MAQEWSKKFYNSSRWKKCRAGYIASVYGLCERCGEVGKIVHHVCYIDKSNVVDDEVLLSWDNLELLCQECHNKEHNKSSAIRYDVKFDESGNLIAKRVRS